jgi:hypothetical protein
MQKIFLLIALPFCACHKPSPPPDPNRHYLGIATIDRIIKIDQAVRVFDSTTLSGQDSIDYFNPPTNRIYEWSVTPQCNSISYDGEYKHGRADIIFRCPGIYHISARIYDSLTSHLLATTHPVEVRVLPDTLLPAWPLQAGDTILIRPGRYFFWERPYTRLDFFTTKKYDYEYPATGLKFTVDTSSNPYLLRFTDSVYLTTFPFVAAPYHRTPEYGVMTNAMDIASLPDFPRDIPVHLSVTWLGITCQGAITRVGDWYYIADWDNSGPVRIITR